MRSRDGLRSRHRVTTDGIRGGGGGTMTADSPTLLDDGEYVILAHNDDIVIDEHFGLTDTVK